MNQLSDERPSGRIERPCGFGRTRYRDGILRLPGLLEEAVGAQP